MLLDDRTAKAIADSTNTPVTAAELQHLPHNPCLIEFSRPIEIAEQVKRGVRLRAVDSAGLFSAGDHGGAFTITAHASVCEALAEIRIATKE